MEGMASIASSPELSEIFREVVVEQAAVAAKRMPSEPRAVSSQTSARAFWLIRARRILTYVVLILAVACGIDLYVRSSPAAVMVASLTLIAALALISALLGEVIANAGWHKQTEFETDGVYSREYEFIPSISRFEVLLIPLFAAILAMWIAFADIYLAVGRLDSAAFSEKLSGGSATYFSIVTFATVGFGDIVPKSTLSRGLVTLEIAVSLYSVTLVLSTAISWLLSQRQRVTENAEAAMRKSIERREAILKEAGLGLYGDPALVVNEVMKRARDRGVPI